MASWRYLDRSLAAPLLLLNFAFYVIVMAIAGWALGSLMMQGEDVGMLTILADIQFFLLLFTRTHKYKHTQGTIDMCMVCIF